MLSTSLVNSVELDDELTTMAAALRSTLAQFDEDYWAKCDLEHRYPADYVDSMAEAGWLGMTIPQEFGGAGQSHVATAVILHEIAASGAGLNGCIPIHMPLFATAPIVRNGSSQLKKAVLPKICSGETVLCFAVSERNTGNDMSKIMTRARQVNGEWLISGQKIWVTQASKADAVILLARFVLAVCLSSWCRWRDRRCAVCRCGRMCTTQSRAVNCTSMISRFRASI